MRTLADLAKQFNQLATTLPQETTNNLSIEAVEVILNDLLMVTPVDSGQAISNWQVALDQPPQERLPAYFPGKLGSTAVVCRTAALEAAQSVLGAKKAGQTVYISNVLPYIRRLNDGYSDQEPAGFVERAILLGRLFTENPSDFARG